MSTLTILTRKSISKDQWFFISPASLLERIDRLNNTNNSDDMASLNIFYAETGEIFFKIALEQSCLCFLVICCFCIADTLKPPNLKKKKCTTQMFSLHKTYH